MWSLPVRPVVAADEAPLSYLARVAEANGYTNVFWLLEAHGAVRPNDFIDQQVIHAALESVLGSRGSPLPAAAAGSGSPGGLVSNGWDLPPDLLDTRSSKLCPRCLNDAPYRRNSWDVRGVLCCPRHGTWLIDRCPKCRNGIGLDYAGVYRCRCGIDLKTVPARQAPDAVVAYHRLIAARLRGDATGPLEPFGEAAEPLERLSASDLLQLPNHLSPRPTSTGFAMCPLGTEPQPLRDAVTFTARLLVDWPANFHAHLTELVGTSSTAALSLGWRSKALSWAFNQGLAEPRFAFLREAYEEFRQKLWTQYVAVQSHRLPETVKEAPSALLGLTDVAVRLGLHRREVRQLVAAGIIDPTVAPERIQEGNWLFDQQEVDRLMAAIWNKDRFRDNGVEIGLPFDLARNAYTRRGKNLASLVRSVLDGAVPIVGIDPAKRGLFQLYVLHDAVLDQLLFAPTSSDATVRCSEMPALLGLRHGAVVWLQARGFLAIDGDGPLARCSARQVRQLAQKITTRDRLFRRGKRLAEPKGDLPSGFLRIAGPDNGCPVHLVARDNLNDGGTVLDALKPARMEYVQPQRGRRTELTHG